MEKKVLEKYTSLIAERKDLTRWMRVAELKIVQLCGEVVADSVTLGKYGKKSLGCKMIMGMPSSEIDWQRQALEKYQRQLKGTEARISDMITDVQNYIDEIEDSRIHRIIRYRYIGLLTWIQVAHRMGKHHTAESYRDAAERYFGKRK